MPPKVIAKGLWGPGLLAHAVLAKYIEHRPLYRVQQELERNGLEITPTTLADWVDAASVALEPIYKAIRTDLIGGNYLQVDETPERVMDPEGRGKIASGWLWVYARPRRGVLFDFQRSRRRAGPDEILKTFNGKFKVMGTPFSER